MSFLHSGAAIDRQSNAASPPKNPRAIFIHLSSLLLTTVAMTFAGHAAPPYTPQMPEQGFGVLLPFVVGGTGLVPPIPQAADDAYETPSDVALAVDAPGVLANDIYTGTGLLQATLVSDVANGTLTLNLDGSFDYAPDAGFHGQDQFTYQANDGGSFSEAATVTVTITETIGAQATDDAYDTPSNATLAVDAPGVLANDIYTGTGLLQASLVSDTTNGTLTLNPDGSFNYVPDAGFHGQDQLTYQAHDGAAVSNVATVILMVLQDTGVNDPPQIVTGKIAFTKKVVDNTVRETHAVVAADFEGDGDIDMVATDYVDGEVYWYENDGGGEFAIHVLDGNLDGAYPAHVGDVDGDGDSDVFVGGYLADTFVWYRNDGGGNFTRINIDTRTDGPHSIITDDLDQDGDVDLVTSSQDAGTIAWYENDGSERFKRWIIDKSALGAKRAGVGDMDGDGDKDVILASYDNNELAWLENDGNQVFVKHVFKKGAKGAYYVAAADVDGDGDMDIFHAAKLNDTIAWHRNDGAGNFMELPIDTQALGARSAISVDIDLDGDVDALASSREDDTVAWHENDGHGGFTAHAIDQMADGAYGVFAIDMDHDGDMDVLSAARNTGEISVHTQIRASVGEVMLGGSLVVDSGRLLTTDADDGPAGLIYTVVDAPDYGELRLNGALVPANGTFTQDDIDNGRLVYVHGGVSTLPDVFSFSVADGGEDGALPAIGDFLIYLTPPPPPPPPA